MTWVQATNTGKGFITHDDQLLLRFVGHPADMFEVYSRKDPEVPQDISDWVTRVGGTTMNDAQAADAIFQVTRYIYTTKEFFKDVLTPAEVQFLMNNWDAHPSITAFWNRLLDTVSAGVDVSRADFQTFLTNLVNAGYLSQARMDEITAGRSA